VPADASGTARPSGARILNTARSEDLTVTHLETLASKSRGWSGHLLERSGPAGIGTAAVNVRQRSTAFRAMPDLTGSGWLKSGKLWLNWEIMAHRAGFEPTTPRFVV
jgi:hypothetical protein